MNLFDITLKEATPSDAEVIFRAIDVHRDDLREWLPFVDSLQTEADEQAYLETVCSVPESERNTVFMIQYKGEFAGLVGYVSSDFQNRRTEIGYWLLPAFRGKGIMTRCVKKLCWIAIDDRGMHRIQIRCATGNAASNAIPQRLNFRLEGTERDGELLINNRYADINVYSLLQDEADNWSED